jgi:hypothetical protein
MKRCPKCGEEKAAECFSRDTTRRDGLQRQCKPCLRVNAAAWRGANRERGAKYQAAYHAANRGRRNEEKVSQRLRRLFGITLADKAALLASQGGVCAICKTAKWSKHGPHVDHCHKTGKVRGILCHNCNVALGMMGDNQRRLRAAIRYLEANDSRQLQLHHVTGPDLRQRSTHRSST